MKFKDSSQFEEINFWKISMKELSNFTIIVTTSNNFNRYHYL